METKLDNLKTRLAAMGAAVERMNQFEESIPAIEVDLLLSELRTMYEEVLRLNQPVAAPAPIVENKAQEIAPEPVAAPKPEDEAKPEPIVETKPEPMAEVKAEPKAEENPVAIPAAEPIVEEEPLFAPEPELPKAITPDENMPSVEELEASDNDMLFEETPEPAPVPEPTPVPEAKKEPLFVPEPVVEPAPKPQSVASKPAAPVAPAPATPVVPEPKVEAPAAPKTESKTKAEPQQPSLFDLLRQSNAATAATATAAAAPAIRTVADTFNKGSETQPQGVEGIVRKQRVADLRTIININDKFSFMSELFRNNMKAYNDFILTLNSIDDREDAMKVVENTASIYNWDNESLAVKTFFNIFDRKF